MKGYVWKSVIIKISNLIVLGHGIMFVEMQNCIPCERMNIFNIGFERNNRLLFEEYKSTENLICFDYFMIDRETFKSCVPPPD